MKAYTDTELRDWWNACDVREAGLSKLAADEARTAREEIERDRHRIKSEWRQLLNLKREGRLTDRAPVDASIRIVKEVGMMHGYRLRFEDREWNDDQYPYPPYWLLRCWFEDPIRREELGRLQKFTEQCTAELMAQGLLLITGRPLPGEDVDEFNASPRGRVSIGFRKEGDCLSFGIQTWVWQGPDGKAFKEFLP